MSLISAIDGQAGDNVKSFLQGINMKRISCFLIIVLVSVILQGILAPAAASGLAVEKNDTGLGILTYNGKPLFAFGPMNELMPWAVKLGSKAYDVRNWAAWQQENGMNYVRGYPESGWGWCPLDAQGRIFPFKTVSSDPPKFDLHAWNPDYWRNFREVTNCLAEHGIIVHLQLFQQCYFEDVSPDRWQFNFWNPRNNINDFTRGLTPNKDGHHPFIEQGVGGNRELLAHQMTYLEHVLEAVGDRGNVFLDFSNEMGDGGLDVQMVRKWIDCAMQTVSAWESRTGLDILVGMDYTHLPRELARYVLAHPRMELIISHGEPLWPEGLVLHRIFGKPVVCVNSRDKSPENYMGFGRKGDDVRLRRLHWRALLNCCQGVGDYNKDSYIEPRGFDKTGEYARHLRTFFSQIKDYKALHSNLDSHKIFKKVVDGPGANHYILESDDEAIIYIEGDVHSSGAKIKGGSVTVYNSHMDAGPAQALIYSPATGESVTQTVEVRGGQIEGLVLHSFVDDIAVHIYR